MGVGRWVVMLGCCVVGACGGDQERARGEAAALLRHLERIAPGAEPEQHRSAVQALGQLSLSVPELVETRETCLLAQQGFLRAGDLQGTARKALKEAQEVVNPVAQKARARSALEASEAALAEAREALGRCRVAAAAVARKY